MLNGSDLGTVKATPGAVALHRSGVNLREYLNRHQAGDWGEFPDYDAECAAGCRALNEQAAAERGTIYSQYSTPLGQLWIVTCVGRRTTLLLPDEH